MSCVLFILLFIGVVFGCTCPNRSGSVCNGNVTIPNSGNVACLDNIVTLNGSLFINNLSQLRGNELSGLGAQLQHITGSVYIQGNTKVNTIQILPNLNTVEGSIIIINNPKLQKLPSFRNLTTIGADLKIYGNKDQLSLQFCSILQINGSVNITSSTCTIQQQQVITDELECLCAVSSSTPKTTVTAIDASITQTINITDAQDRKLGYVKFISNTLNTNTNLTISELPSALLNGSALSDYDSGLIVSPMVSFNLQSGQSSFNKSVIIQLILSVWNESESYSLVYLSDNEWVALGPELLFEQDNNATFAVGSTTHFTTFAVLLNIQNGDGNGDGNEDIGVSLSSSQNSAIITSTSDSNDDDGLSTGAIVGIVVGTIAFAIFAVIIVLAAIFAGSMWYRNQLARPERQSVSF